MKYNKNIDLIEPYRVSDGASLSQQDKGAWLKLDWNESTSEPNPDLKEELCKFILENDMYAYPDTTSDKLKKQIAEYNGVDSDNILLYNGSDSALESIFGCFIENGNTRVCVFEPTYTQILPFINFNGGIVKQSPIRDIFGEHEYNFNDISDCDIVYIVNPNNPTGGIIKKNTIVGLVEKNPEKLFIIDEAYYEFSKVSVSDQVKRFKNLIVTRTFSKAFGLAGVRIGYLVTGEQNISILSKIRNSKNINSIAQFCASYSLENINQVQAHCDSLEKSKIILYNKLKQKGLIYSYSHANFVLVKVKDSKLFISELKKKKILVRDRSLLMNLENCVRITVCNLEQIAKLCEVIEEYHND